MSDQIVPVLQYGSIMFVPSLIQILDTAELKLILISIIPLMIKYFSMGPKFKQIQPGTIAAGSFAMLILMSLLINFSPKFKSYIAKPKENRTMGAISYASIVIMFMIFIFVGGMFNIGGSNNVKFTNI